MFLHRERGFTLIELSLSMLVLGILSLITIPLIQDSFEDKKLQNDSEGVEVIGKAAADYIRDNYSTIMAKLTVTNAPESIMITVSMLKNSGALQVNTATTNDYDQSICILVKKHTVPTAANTTVVGRELLQGLLITEGGEAINDIDLAYYAGNIGATAGVITAANLLEIKGVGGSWIMPTAAFDNLVNDRGQHCNGLAGNVRLTPGHAVIGLWFPSDRTASMLSRSTVGGGSSEANLMNADINMNNNDLLNVREIIAKKVNIGAKPTMSSAGIPANLEVFDANGRGTITTGKVFVSARAQISTAHIATIAYINDLSGLLQINKPTYRGGTTVGSNCPSIGAIVAAIGGQILTCKSSANSNTKLWTEVGGGAGTRVTLKHNCTLGVSWPLLTHGSRTRITQVCDKSRGEVNIQAFLPSGVISFEYRPITAGDSFMKVRGNTTLHIDSPVCWGYECSAYFYTTGDPTEDVPRTLVYFEREHSIVQ